MGGKAKLDWGLTIFKHIAKASATNDVLGVRYENYVKQTKTEVTIRLHFHKAYLLLYFFSVKSDNRFFKVQ